MASSISPAVIALHPDVQAAQQASQKQQIDMSVLKLTLQMGQQQGAAVLQFLEGIQPSPNGEGQGQHVDAFV